jgi:LysR family transcriptional regulator, low CO2-responsive transcriptional regulator
MDEHRFRSEPVRVHQRSPLQRVIDPLRLQLVLEVGRHGSITRAADACSISQPTASAHLRTLEAAAGQPLFARAGRGTQLTDAGRVLATHAAIVLSALEGLDEELSALGGAQAGTLRVAACGDFGNYVLPQVLSAFAADRPRVEIRVAIAPSGEVARAVARGAADVGIAGEMRRRDGVTAERLVRDELIGIGAADLPLVGPFALHDKTLVVPTTASSTRAHVERLFTTIGRPARLVELDSVEAVKRAVAARVGIAFVSMLAASDELERGELRAFAFRGAAPLERWLELLRPEHRRPTPVAQAFEHALRAYCHRYMRNTDGTHPELDLPQISAC